jgi:hypothetical protein
MQGELKEAMAALAATQPPATKREREEPQVTDDESPALKK